jgi:serine protease AprX
MHLKNIWVFLLSVLYLMISQAAQAQFNGDVYYAQFSDKLNSTFSTDKPSQFLSDKSIQKRIKFNIPFDEKDLPINQSYIESVIESGAVVHFTSKWLNGIGFTPKNSASLTNIENLPFIEALVLIKETESESNTSNLVKFGSTENQSQKSQTITESIYGHGLNQIEMLNGDLLHLDGFWGEGITIAVLDNGFLHADQLTVFDSIWMNNQVLSTYDFVNKRELSFTTGSHGTKVLSVMAANVPELFVGAAPKANFHLIRTEIKDSESVLEEYLWTCGAEYADSVGADIINSSLSYTEFDNALQNHQYTDLDGETTIITQAAEIAVSKGILIVNSVGNYANKSWQHVGVPADGKNVLSVGAVDSEGNWVEFSSIGPTADGRIKPNVVAQGLSTTMANTDNDIIAGNGTSFSAPLITGLAACLWETNPDLSNLKVKEIIEKSANRYFMPDQNYGYGIPDFYLASQLANLVNKDLKDFTIIKSFPNPVFNEYKLTLLSKVADMLSLNIFDISGKLIRSEEHQITIGVNYILVPEFNNFKLGVYIIELKSSSQHSFQKIIKLNQ